MNVIEYSPYNKTYEKGILTIKGIENVKSDLVYGPPMEKYNLSNRTLKIEIEEGAKTLDTTVFKDFKHVKSVTLPSTLKKIGNSAFLNCTELEEINLPTGLEYIDNCAFTNCHNLKEIYIPKTVEYISPNAFALCNLEKIEISKDNPRYSDCGCNVIYDKETDTLIKACNTSKIPEKTKIINAYAFARTNIEEIILPQTTEIIDEAAFALCNNLENIELNEGLKIIKEFAFNLCIKLNKITLPSTLIAVKRGSFNDAGLETLIINCNTNIIDSNFNDKHYAVKERSPLKEIYIKEVDESSNFYKKYRKFIKPFTVDILIESGKSIKEINNILKDSQQSR